MNDEAMNSGVLRLFLARSVAVVGASSNPAKLGHVILANILNGGYEGNVYAVNPKAGEILGLRVYPSVSEIPSSLDLVVVVVPAPFVPGVLREAAGKGARAGIIISGGFREAGREDLEQELLDIVTETGLRLVGPNCQGINYRPNKLCASWPLVTASGSLAVISQSGTVAATLAGWAVDEGLGISATVSLGNQADVCETDLIDFFADDEGSRVIALYLEGAKHGRRFLEAVKRAIPKKPIVVLKSGRTEGGQRAAASHTRSLAGRDDVFDAACRQFGIVRVPDIESLYDSAKALASLDLEGPLPRTGAVSNSGDRVFAVTSSGGCGILATDEAERLGLRVPPLHPEMVTELKEAGLLPTAILSNPLDLTVAPAAHFEATVSIAERYDLADVYLLIFGDPIPGATEVVQRLRERVGSRLVVVYLGGGEVEKTERLRMHAVGIPVFPTPQRAIRAIRDVVWAKRNRVFQKKPGFSIPERMSVHPSNVLLEPEAISLLHDYGIPYPDHGVARSAEEAVDIAARLGYPVVLKIVSPDVIHKSDVGGVVVGIGDGSAVVKAYDRIVTTVREHVPDADSQGVLVSKQAPDGLEVIVGALDDAMFGPTVMFGLGGIFTEVLKDVTFRVAPLERRDAREMMREIRGFRLLEGARGQARYDTEALVELLLAVSRMVTDRPEIKELDLNPVRLFEQGLMPLDVRILFDNPISCAIMPLGCQSPEWQ